MGLFSNQLALDVQRNIREQQIKFDGRNREDNWHIWLSFSGKNFHRGTLRGDVYLTNVLGDYDYAHGLLEQPIVLSKKAVASSLTGEKKNNNIIQSERSIDLANLISGWQMGQWSQCSPGVCEEKKVPGVSINLVNLKLNLGPFKGADVISNALKD